MFHQSDAFIDLSTPEYDFSQENPLFREALRARFLQAAMGVAALSDEEILNLNAAGIGIPKKPEEKPHE